MAKERQTLRLKKLGDTKSDIVSLETANKVLNIRDGHLTLNALITAINDDNVMCTLGDSAEELSLHTLEQLLTTMDVLETVVYLLPVACGIDVVGATTGKVIFGLSFSYN